MKYLFVFLILCSVLTTLSSSNANKLAGGEKNIAITQEASREIINGIRQKYAPMYKKYQGIESERQADTTTYDSRTNKLIGSDKVHMIRKDYFYKEPEITVIRYYQNGEELPASKYRPLKTDPGLQVFDDDGEKHYDTYVVGYKMINKIKCFEIKVTPKEITHKHFQGFIYVAVSDLAIIRSTGRTAKLNYPLENLNMEFTFTQIDELSVLTSGTIESKVNIPIVLPHRHFITKIHVIKSRPIIKD